MEQGHTHTHKARVAGWAGRATSRPRRTPPGGGGAGRRPALQGSCQGGPARGPGSVPRRHGLSCSAHHHGWRRPPWDVLLLKRRSTRSCKPAGEGAGPGARRWARWVPTHRCLSAPAASFLAAAASAIGHEASRPARGGGEGGFAFSYFKSQKTLLALLLPGPGTLVGAVGICGAGRGTGGGPGFCPPPGGRPGPFPADFRLDGGGFLGPLFLTEGPAPTTFVEDEQQLGGRAGPEQGQGRGRAVRGRARAVRASRQEAAPVVHAPGCAHHRPALHPCRGWRARPPKVPLATPARGHPPGACSCARRGS